MDYSKDQENWDFADLPLSERQNSVHFFHHYTAKFIPQIPEKFIRKYSNGAKIVVDPFMGSGTTLIVAKQLNMNSYGIDTNPLAVKIVKAKTLLATEQVLAEIDDFLRWISPLKEVKNKPHETTNIIGKAPLFDGSETWFRDDVAIKILSILTNISKYSNQVRNFIEVGISDLLRGMSNARMDNNMPTLPDAPIYIDRKHYYREVNNLTREIPVYSRVWSQIRRMKDAIVRFNKETNNSLICEPLLGDSRELSKFIDHCDLVFTSPPYWSAQNYQRLHSLSFKLFKLKIDQEEEIGRNGHLSYQDDMFKVNLEIAKVLRGYYGLVIGEDKKNDEHLKVVEGVKAAGFALVDTYVRKLSNQTFFSKQIQTEYIYVFKIS